MTPTEMTLLCSLSILVGIFFVGYGLLKYPSIEEPSSDSPIDQCSDVLAVPTDQVVPLQFKEEVESVAGADAPISKAPGPIMKVLKAPFRCFHRVGNRRSKEELHRPVANGVELNAKTIKETTDTI